MKPPMFPSPMNATCGTGDATRRSQRPAVSSFSLPVATPCAALAGRDEARREIRALTFPDAAAEPEKWREAAFRTAHAVLRASILDARGAWPGGGQR